MSALGKVNNLINQPESYEAWSMPQVGQAISKPNKKDGMLDELQRIKKDAYNEAYQSGLAKAEAFIQEQQTQLQQKIDLLSNPLQKVDDAIKNMLMQCVVLLTQVCMEHELSIDETKLHAIVNSVVNLLDEDSLEIQIYFSADDYAFMTKNLDDKKIDPSIHYQVDEKLHRGEVRVATTRCSIDATVANRMRTACQDLFQSFEIAS